MAWPTTQVPTGALDEGADSPATARMDLFSAVLNLNAIQASRSAANGIAALDSNGQVPVSQLSGAAVLNALLAADGTGSGLDADLLDGKDSTDFVLSNASTHVIAPSGTLHAQEFSRNAPAVGGSILPWTSLAVRTIPAIGVTPNNGFGTQIEFNAYDSVPIDQPLGFVRMSWADVSIHSSKIDLRARADDTTIRNALTLAPVAAGHVLELREVGSPAASPPTGSWWIYPLSTGWAIKDPGGTESLLGAGGAGVSDHGALTGLGDIADHPYAFLHDGSRAMTGELQMAQNAVLFTDRGTDPTAPAASKSQIYTKAGDLYLQTSAGVIGPFGPATGVTAHGSLTGLTGTDHHTQYLLRQPTANVVINDTGGDFDFRIEAVGKADMFVLDAGLGTVVFDSASPVGGYTVEINGNGRTNGALSVGSDKVGLNVFSSGAAATGVLVAATTGYAARFQRTSGTTPATAAVTIEELGSTGGTLLRIDQPKSGMDAIDIRTLAGLVTAFRVTGDGQVVVNPTSNSAVKFIVHGATANLFTIESASNVVQIGSSTLTSGMLNVRAAINQHAVSALSVQAGYFAGYFAATSGDGVFITVAARPALVVENTGTFSTATFARSGNATSAPCVQVALTSGTDTAAAFEIVNFGSGALLKTRSTVGGFDDFAVYQNSILDCLENTGNPAQPTTDRWRMFFKSDGLYTIDDLGAVVGPLGTAGGALVPAGSDRSLQFKSGSILGGSANLLWSASDLLTITGRISVSTAVNTGITVGTTGTAGGLVVSSTASGIGALFQQTGTGHSVQITRNNAAAGAALTITQTHASSPSAAVLVDNFGAGDMFACADAGTLVFRVLDGGYLYLKPRAAPAGVEGYIYSGTDNKLYYHNGSAFIDLTAAGSTSPGGLDTYVQFNNALAFGGTAEFTWNNSTKVLAVNGDIRVGDDLIAKGITLAATPLSVGYDVGNQTLAILGGSDVAKVFLKTDSSDGMLHFDDGGYIGWCSTDDAAGTLDRKLVRNATNGLEVQDGSGNKADLYGRRWLGTDLIYNERTETGTTATTSDGLLTQINFNPSGAFTSVMNIGDFKSTFAGAQNYNSLIRGLYVNATNTGTGTHAEHRLIQGEFYSGAAATFTDVSLLDLGFFNGAGGTVATGRGIHLRQPTGAVTTAYPIFSSWQAASYFAGRLDSDVGFRAYGSSSGSVIIQALSNGGDWTLTLPGTDGAVGSVLSSDGAGVTEWVSPKAAVGASALIQYSDGAGNFVSSAKLSYSAASGVLCLANTAGQPAAVFAGAAGQTADIFAVTDSVLAPLFVIGETGQLMTNQATANTNVPAGATAQKLPWYNGAGTLLGYVPVYAAPW